MEIFRKNFLASIVPVIVNAVLDSHHLVVDIIAFVSRGDFPRSRLGEKQRGKVLASWVTRKMRTIAQFSIRDSDGADSSMTEVGDGSHAGSMHQGIAGAGAPSLKSVAEDDQAQLRIEVPPQATAHQQQQKQQQYQEFAPLPAGISEMPGQSYTYDGGRSDSSLAFARADGDASSGGFGISGAGSDDTQRELPRELPTGERGHAGAVEMEADIPYDGARAQWPRQPEGEAPMPSYARKPYLDLPGMGQGLGFDGSGQFVESRSGDLATLPSQQPQPQQQPQQLAVHTRDDRRATSRNSRASGENWPLEAIMHMNLGR